MKKIIKIFSKIIFGALLIFLALLAWTLLPVPGNLKTYTVMSGSMEPAIRTGSLIFVLPHEEYAVGDIVTKKGKGKNDSVTHRIISKENYLGVALFESKGDANEDPDGEKFSQEEILGKMIGGLPFAGYPIGFARTGPGFVVLVVIPAAIMIYEEGRKIKEEIGRRFFGRKNKIEEHPLIGSVRFEEGFSRPEEERARALASFQRAREIELEDRPRRKKLDL